MRTPLASYGASGASNNLAYPDPLLRQTHLKITLCKVHYLRVQEGLILKEQQHRAAAIPGKQEATSAA